MQKKKQIVQNPHQIHKNIILIVRVLIYIYYKVNINSNYMMKHVTIDSLMYIFFTGYSNRHVIYIYQI